MSRMPCAHSRHAATRKSLQRHLKSAVRGHDRLISCRFVLNSPPRRLRIRASAAWDESTTISELKLQLDTAVEDEDYELAARIRDALKQKQIDNKLAVEDANKRFYDAFNSGSYQRMDSVWGKGDHVQCIHPGSPCIGGRELVMESWAVILKGIRPRAFRIDLDDVCIYATEAYGVVTCLEVVDTDESVGRVAATNIFEKQNGKWVMVHHHGSQVPTMFRLPKK